MLGKLRRTYGELLFSAGEGGLAATGALGKITVRDWYLLEFRVGDTFTAEMALYLCQYTVYQVVYKTRPQQRRRHI